MRQTAVSSYTSKKTQIPFNMKKRRKKDRNKQKRTREIDGNLRCHIRFSSKSDFGYFVNSLNSIYVYNVYVAH